MKTLENKIGKITEHEIELGLYQHFVNDDYSVQRQVPLCQKRIDIVAYDEIVVTAIELKIRDWKGALRQATVNGIACDFTYVAIWHEHINPALNVINLFKERGVGLMMIDENFTPTVVVNARKNQKKKISKKAYDDVKQYLRTV